MFEPSFLDEIRARVPLSRVIGRKVVWDLRRSNQAKGDWWAPCPFHGEKTASFHVDDQKGFYYCFGCHAKGDALNFLREAEGLDFIEAVFSIKLRFMVELVYGFFITWSDFQKIWIFLFWWPMSRLKLNTIFPLLSKSFIW